MTIDENEMNQARDRRTLARNLEWLDAIPVGWRQTLQVAVERLRAVDPAIEITEAKEKFGSLRIYIDRGSAEAYAIIDAATAEANRRCEECGADARLMHTKSRYYSGRCPRHATGFTLAAVPPTVTVRIMIDGARDDGEPRGNPGDTSDEQAG